MGAFADPLLELVACPDASCDVMGHGAEAPHRSSLHDPRDRPRAVEQRAVLVEALGVEFDDHLPARSGLQQLSLLLDFLPRAEDPHRATRGSALRCIPTT